MKIKSLKPAADVEWEVTDQMLIVRVNRLVFDYPRHTLTRRQFNAYDIADMKVAQGLVMASRELDNLGERYCILRAAEYIFSALSRETRSAQNETQSWYEECIVERRSILAEDQFEADFRLHAARCALTKLAERAGELPEVKGILGKRQEQMAVELANSNASTIIEGSLGIETTYRMNGPVAHEVAEAYRIYEVKSRELTQIPSAVCFMLLQSDGHGGCVVRMENPEPLSPEVFETARVLYSDSAKGGQYADVRAAVQAAKDL